MLCLYFFDMSVTLAFHLLTAVTKSGLFVKVVNGSFTLQLRANEVYTLTTVADGNKGSYGIPPNSSAFPVPYVETFESNFSINTLCFCCLFLLMKT